MTRPARYGSVFVLLPKVWDRCVLLANLRYNRANETAAEGYDGNGGGLEEASMKRGELVSRRSRQSRRLCPSSLLRIESP
jgi:hypothetical protein